MAHIQRLIVMQKESNKGECYTRSQQATHQGIYEKPQQLVFANKVAHPSNPRQATSFSSDSFSLSWITLIVGRMTKFPRLNVSQSLYAAPPNT